MLSRGSLVARSNEGAYALQTPASNMGRATHLARTWLSDELNLSVSMDLAEHIIHFSLINAILLSGYT